MKHRQEDEYTEYDYPGQRERREAVYRIFASTHDRMFNDEGEYTGPDMGHAPRMADLLHSCIAYFGSKDEGAVKKANAVIRGLSMGECHFTPYHSLWLLRTMPHLLEEDIRLKLIEYSRQHLDEFSGDDHDFVGVNDNFPCVSAYTLMAGGLRFDRKELYDRGAQRLRQLKEMLERRGAASEYSSPSYSLLQLHALAALVELTEHDTELRSLVLGCEERIWVDYLSHVFLPTGRMAGPYSRSYTPSLTTWGRHPAALYVLFGEALQENGLPEHDRNQLQLQLDHYELAADFHCPRYLRDWFINRSYPFSYEATTEFNSSTDAVVSVQKLWSGPSSGGDETGNQEYPSGSGRISTYMTKEYSLGIASNEWHCGSQTDTFLAMYTTCCPIKGPENVRAVFARYSVNDRLPGQNNGYPELGTTNGPMLFWDQGRKLGVHHDRTAMMLYKPRLYARKNVTSLRLMLVVPLAEGEPEEIWLGNRRLEGNAGDSEQQCTVYLKDGHTFLAFHPLVPVNHGRQKAVRVEKANGNLILSFYNYEGAARDFGRREFALTGNGFVCEIGSAEEYGSFEAFRQDTAEFELFDEYVSNTHMRDTTVRKSMFARPGVRLACEYSPVSEGIRYMTVNGRATGETMLKIDGLEANELPFVHH